jgi:hypothetical protein
VIYLPFSLTTGLNNIDAIRDQIFIPGTLGILMVYTLLVAGGIGAVLKRFVRQGFELGDPWERVASSLEKHHGGYALVIGKDSEYIGRVHIMGVEENHREILLKDPIWIIRNAKHDVEHQVSMGKELLFTESDIQRIVLFEEIEPESQK